MSSTQMSNERTTQIPSAGKVDMKLEVVVIPVSDVDRAKRFYLSMGWRLDADFANGDSWRVVQMTPPGSRALSSSARDSRRQRRAPFRDCSSWSMTSTQHAPSSSDTAST